MADLQALTSYEQECWNRVPVEDIPISREDEELQWSYEQRACAEWAPIRHEVEMYYRDGGTGHVEAEIRRLNRERENRKESTDIEKLRKRRSEWYLLRDEANARVQAGQGEERVGKHPEQDAFSYIAPGTKWKSLESSAVIAVQQRGEEIEEYERTLQWLQFRISVCERVLKDALDGRLGVEPVRENPFSQEAEERKRLLKRLDQNAPDLPQTKRREENALLAWICADALEPDISDLRTTVNLRIAWKRGESTEDGPSDYMKTLISNTLPRYGWDGQESMHRTLRFLAHTYITEKGRGSVKQVLRPVTMQELDLPKLDPTIEELRSWVEIAEGEAAGVE